MLSIREKNVLLTEYFCGQLPVLTALWALWIMPSFRFKLRGTQTQQNLNTHFHVGLLKFYQKFDGQMWHANLWLFSKGRGEG